jgi:membrane peptidoglycan carboxypeptidase
LLITAFAAYFFSLKINFSQQKSSYKHQLYTDLSQIDERIKNWALKIEDKRFYQHF